MLLEGMHLPLTTPFFPDGRLNLRKLAQNVARYSLTPAAAILVLGPSGEANLLSGEERREVLAAAVQAASVSKVMLAGVAEDGVRTTLEAIEHAGKCGYDAAVVRSPASPELAQSERLAYWQMVLDRTALPVVLAGDIPFATLFDLASHTNALGFLCGATDGPSIRSLIEATAGVRRTVNVTQVFAAVTGRMLGEHTARSADGLLSATSLAEGAPSMTSSAPSFKMRTKAVGFQVLGTATAGMLDALRAGAVGVAPAFAAAAPQACHEVLAAWKDGDPTLAEEKQLRLLRAAQGSRDEVDIASLKYACDLGGYYGGMPRLPHLPLTGDDRTAVERTMSELGA